MLSANANTILALQSDNRVFTYSVIVNGTTDITDYVLGGTITESGCSSNRLNIGEFCKSQCTLEVDSDAISDWYHAYFTVSVSINNESIPLGKYYVPTANTRNNPETISVTGYDTSWLWDDPFVYTSTSSLDCVDDIETYTGQTITNKNLLEDFTIPLISSTENTETYMTMMSYIAGLQGYSIRNNRLGNFELYKCFTDTPYTIGKNEIFESGISYDLKETVISSYTISNADQQFVTGSGYGVVNYNPLITEEIASELDDYIGESYTAADISFRGNPLLQIGDTLSVTIGGGGGIPAIVGVAVVGQSAVGVVSTDGITVPIMEQTITLDGGIAMTVHSHSEYNTIEYQTPAQKIVTLQNQMNGFKSEIIQTQESITARVTYNEEQMSQVEQTVNYINGTVNEMNASLNENGLQIFSESEGDTVTTITGDGMTVNILDGVTDGVPTLGDELLSATSEGVSATRLTADEYFKLDTENVTLQLSTFYNSIHNEYQVGLFVLNRN